MKKRNSKGFTLAELLIVVAIIAVLTAIAIPVFSGQLEKSREAVDAANIRAAYAEIMADALTGDPSGMTMSDYNVTLKQQTAGWSAYFDFPDNLNGHASAEPTPGVAVTFTYDPSTGEVTMSVKKPTP